MKDITAATYPAPNLQNVDPRWPAPCSTIRVALAVARPRNRECTWCLAVLADRKSDQRAGEGIVVAVTFRPQALGEDPAVRYPECVLS
jgi:hypothetical protein